METKQQKSKEERNYQVTDKNNLLLGSIIATIIAISPYLYYLHESVPDTKVWDTFLFTYNSGYFGSANNAMYFVFSKAIPLLLIFIWFFTCRHWWYHTLLVPVTMYVYQIINVFNDDIKYVDEFELIYMIPVMAIIIPSVYLLRAKMFNKINEATKSMEELEDEFKVSPKNFWERVKQYF
ncbi:hypothetical protein E1J38_009255 [Seonamhaeicola sediminis]|uniref:Uncharacterized protein n=1 Tax=Seonamhaeicola sediminis TaxID=2528206 RepID=A0A562YFE4_9FLAO|nr:hypothetical protein [Seonamhaeicola sediminis]TWO33036.1 hypothetical protein E1J38_009255 [Seonamhaeicola sediminis]